MNVGVLWAGKTRNPHFRALVEDYAARTRRLFPLTIKEVRSSSERREPAVTRREEGRKILATLPKKGYVVALAPGGRAMTTAAFAAWIAHMRRSGADAVWFVVGGEEGLHDDVLARADGTLSLTPMTLPHELARVVLMEQIYRAGAMLAGHPYPR